MKKMYNTAILALMVTALAGCSMGSSMLNNKAGTPSASNIQVGNNLAMPPDLQLPPPEKTVDAYQPNVGTGEGAAHDLAVQSGTELPATAPSTYADYNIALEDAKGRPKSPGQLSADLKAAKLVRKKQINPNYGTIRNIGNIFSDQ